MFLQHLKNVKSISITIVTIITTEAGAAVRAKTILKIKSALYGNNITSFLKILPLKSNNITN
jgi:hypothetical protein